MKKRFTIILIVLSLMGLGHTWAQQLKFDCQLIDAGTMTEDDAPRTYSFVARNVSDCVQEISRVQTTCGCTKYGVSKMKLQPGDSCKIQLTFTPNGYPGTIDTRAFVYLKDAGTEPVAKIDCEEWYFQAPTFGIASNIRWATCG